MKCHNLYSAFLGFDFSDIQEIHSHSETKRKRFFTPFFCDVVILVQSICTSTWLSHAKQLFCKTGQVSQNTFSRKRVAFLGILPYSMKNILQIFLALEYVKCSVKISGAIHSESELDSCCVGDNFIISSVQKQRLYGEVFIYRQFILCIKFL